MIGMGKDIPISTVVTMIVGIVFVVSGNYLPKSRQNYTIGIKLPWTLADVDNWNKTHRLAGGAVDCSGDFRSGKTVPADPDRALVFLCTGGHGLPAGALLVYFVCEKRGIDKSIKNGV